MNLREQDTGAAERALAVVLNSGAHLWHNRPGVDVGGMWRPGTPAARAHGTAVRPGLFVPSAVRLYGGLLAIYQLDADLMAHLASYALLHTEWRDLKVCCAALMLVQPQCGEAVREDDGSVAFYDDDYRAIGEAMILFYAKQSTHMLTPKAVLRVAELLEVPEIASLHREAGFADPAGRKPLLGRWPSAARQWLAVREHNPRLLEGLVVAGYKETIKRIARKAGYRPETQAFFEILGWPQRQAPGGHRRIGLEGLELRRRERFDGLDEAAICERIVAERLTYKEAIGRLPPEVGLTPAIMVALLPSLSDRDLRILTPTLESLGLLEDGEVRARWDRAIETATDQRALNVARNVRSRKVRERLEESADIAVQRAASELIDDANLRVMFLIDKSGSMQHAIEQSKDALSRIAAGVPLDRLHIATFDTIGRVLKPKAASRRGFEHLLKRVRAEGGTVHASALSAFQRDGVRIPDDATLIVIVVGDENGETGDALARAFTTLGYAPAAIGLIVSVNPRFGRGRTMRDASVALGVPFAEVAVEQFDDPYQVTRVLKTLLDAPVLPGSRSGWLDRVLATPLLEKPL